MVLVLVFPRATPDLVRAHVPPDARVIAIDAGAEALRAAGRLPEAIVGDMDSVSGETLGRLRAAGVVVHAHPPAKRDTDAALALRLARPDEEIRFLGAGGGRVDHALANLHLLAACGGRAHAVDEDAWTWVAAPERPLELRLPEGTLLSVLPFDTRCEGVTLHGMAYGLSDAVMEAGDPYGVSNVCGPPPQRVEVRRGRLLVVEPLPPPVGAHAPGAGE